MSLKPIMSAEEYETFLKSDDAATAWKLLQFGRTEPSIDEIKEGEAALRQFIGASAFDLWAQGILSGEKSVAIDFAIEMKNRALDLLDRLKEKSGSVDH
jgi:hypothetical protein